MMFECKISRERVADEFHLRLKWQTGFNDGTHGMARGKRFI